MNLEGINKQRLAWIIVAMVLTAVAIFFGVQYPIPEPPAELPTEVEEVVALGVTHFSGMEISSSETDALVVNQTSTGDIVEFRDGGSVVWRVADGGAVTHVSGGLTLSDGDAVVADDLRVSAQTSITVTNGNPFTPTGTYQPITAAGEVTPTVAIGTAGDVVVLINTSAQTINIADSGTMMLNTAVALGQYDVLVLWCDGTNWLQIATANN